MLKWSPCQTEPPDCCKTLTHVSGFPFRPKINGTILKMKGRDSPGCHVLLLLPVYFKKNYILRCKNDLHHKSVDQKREGLNNVKQPLTINNEHPEIISMRSGLTSASVRELEQEWLHCPGVPGLSKSLGSVWKIITRKTQPSMFTEGSISTFSGALLMSCHWKGEFLAGKR